MCKQTALSKQCMAWEDVLDWSRTIEIRPAHKRSIGIGKAMKHIFVRSWTRLICPTRPYPRACDRRDPPGGIVHFALFT